VRLHKTHPQIAKIMANAGPAYLNSPSGLAPRALRDIRNASAAGRFDISDPVVALACAGGSILAVLHVIDGRTNAQIDRASDDVAANLLRMFGVPTAQAREIATRPLPRAKNRPSLLS
jgi:hypothetical protein